MGFLISKARLIFIQLKQAFTNVSILCHFDLEDYIRIEINASSYAISMLLNQLTSNNLGQ